MFELGIAAPVPGKRGLRHQAAAAAAASAARPGCRPAGRRGGGATTFDRDRFFGNLVHVNSVGPVALYEYL